MSSVFKMFEIVQKNMWESVNIKIRIIAKYDNDMQLINCTFVYLVPFFVKFGVGCICYKELGLINKYLLNYQYPGKIALLLLFVLLVHWCFFLF